MTTSLTLKTALLLLFLISMLILSDCKKEEPKLNIVLYDKSLDTIRLYIQGMWHLTKVTGGLCATCGSPVKDNPYMNINNDHILFGNDTGITVDTTIVWKKDSYAKDSTYLLTYRAYKYYAFPINYVVDRIEDNYLILIDYSSDPFYRYYLK
jgi:hypothetical protein